MELCGQPINLGSKVNECQREHGERRQVGDLGLWGMSCFEVHGPQFILGKHRWLQLCKDKARSEGGAGGELGVVVRVNTMCRPQESYLLFFISQMKAIFR